MRRGCLVLLLIGLAGCVGKPAPVADFAVLTPRPFGYVIGDEIHHRIELTTRNGVHLQRAGLPRPGAINRWLELNRVEVEERRRGDGYHYQIDVYYQVFYAPLAVKMLTVPSFQLPLAQGSNTAVQTVPAWPFTLSPLRELSLRKDGRGEYLRPDASPRVAVSKRLQVGIAVSAFGLVLSAAYLAFSHGLWPGLRRRVFKTTALALAKLPPGRWGEALAMFHDALNLTNSAPLFKPQLAEFIRHHPGYHRVAKELAWFFDCSERYFFAVADNPNAAADLARLQRLCARCRNIEQGLP